MPTNSPATSAPTLKGYTHPPTSAPTSMPSFENKGYKDMLMYKNFLENRQRFMANSTNVVFSHFFYKGSDIVGDYDKWNFFTNNALAMNIPNNYFSSVYMSYDNYDFATNTYSSESRTCTTPELVKQLADALQQGIRAHFICDERWWRVYQCGEVSIICINCDRKCPICPANQFSSWIYKSCRKGLFARSAIINWKVAVEEGFPLINKLDIQKIHPKSVDIGVNVTKQGIITCAAFPADYTIESTLLISSNPLKGILRLTSVPYVGNLTINGLYPDRDYSIYCFTESFTGYVMTLSRSLSTLLPIHTECCMSILPRQSYDNIPEFNPTASVKVFIYYIDSKPDENVDIKVILESKACSSNAPIDIYSNALAIPSTVTLSSTSNNQLIRFIIRGSPGCYQLTVAAVSHLMLIQNATSTLNILSSTQEPDAPVIISASLSNDGNRIVLLFDSDVDTSKYNAAFNCSQIFQFKLSNKTLCNFIAANKIQFLLLTQSQVSINSDLLNIGDPIHLMDNVITSNFPRATKKNMAATVYLLPPESPVTPIPSLSSSSVIGNCDDIVLDPTSSTGNAGRDWAEVTWSITDYDLVSSPQNISKIINFLNTNYNSSTFYLVKIPNIIFFTEMYRYSISYSFTFRLLLRNFMGGVGISSTSVVIKNTIVPRVTITSPPKIVIYRSQSVSVFAQAILPECAGASSFSLVYSWRVYDGNQYQVTIFDFFFSRLIFHSPR